MGLSLPELAEGSIGHIHFPSQCKCSSHDRTQFYSLVRMGDPISHLCKDQELRLRVQFGKTTNYFNRKASTLPSPSMLLQCNYQSLRVQEKHSSDLKVFVNKDPGVLSNCRILILCANHCGNHAADQ